MTDLLMRLHMEASATVTKAQPETDTQPENQEEK